MVFIFHTLSHGHHETLSYWNNVNTHTHTFLYRDEISVKYVYLLILFPSLGYLQDLAAWGNRKFEAPDII